MFKKEKILFTLSIFFKCLLFYGFELLLCIGVNLLASSVMQTEFSLTSIAAGWIVFILISTILCKIGER